MRQQRDKLQKESQRLTNLTRSVTDTEKALSDIDAHIAKLEEEKGKLILSQSKQESERIEKLKAKRAELQREKDRQITLKKGISDAEKSISDIDAHLKKLEEAKKERAAKSAQTESNEIEALKKQREGLKKKLAEAIYNSKEGEREEAKKNKRIESLKNTIKASDKFGL